MPYPPLRQSLPAKSFGFVQAQHLLSRAGFGGTPTQVAALQKMGLINAVDFLVDYQRIDNSSLPPHEADPDIYRPPTPDERALIARARRGEDNEVADQVRAEFLRRQGMDRQQMQDLERWWLSRMIATPRPLEEKLTLLWHGHFASNHRTVHDSYLMIRQNEMLRENAAGNFGTLATNIVHDPAMIKFLNNDQNRRAKPNENLARELMELFTLGEGHYTEQDIKEGARALTGYTFDDNDFVFRQQMHDFGSKSILGSTGAFKGDEFVKILLKNPACPIWVSFKLYKHFVADLDEGLPGTTSDQRAFLQDMAQLLQSSNYELRPVLRALFRSQHFYDDAVVGRQIKSPVQLVVGSVRTLNTPRRELNLITGAMNLMGQKLFEPPSVAGWDGGRSWINTSTLFTRQNLTTYLITGKSPIERGWNQNRVNYDPMNLLEDQPDLSPEKIVDHLTATLLGSNVTADRKAQLLVFLRQRKQMNNEALVGLLLLITTMPEYQLC